MHNAPTRIVRGFALVEAVVASAIALVVITGIIGTFSYTYRAAINNRQSVQAAFVEEEGLEAVRVLRDNGWTTNIASQTPSATAYLAFTNGEWGLTTTNTFIDEMFERKVVFSNVYRDTNKNIVASGGTLDPNIRLVTVSVSWSSRGATTTRSLSTYLANVFND